MIKEVKLCGRCKKSFPLSYFSKEKAKPDGLAQRCRACCASMYRTWREANIEVIRVKDRITHYKSTYGLSHEDAVKLVENRIGKCKICLIEAPLVVDHCHTSGGIRGLICQSCNSVLGYAKDNTNTLLSAVRYLKEYYEES